MFRVGDYVQRKEECQDSWWKSRCKEKYVKHYKGVFKVTGVDRDDDGELNIKLENLDMRWQYWRFNLAKPNIPFNESDYL